MDLRLSPPRQALGESLRLRPELIDAFSLMKARTTRTPRESDRQLCVGFAERRNRRDDPQLGRASSLMEALLILPLSTYIIVIPFFLLLFLSYLVATD